MRVRAVVLGVVLLGLVAVLVCKPHGLDGDGGRSPSAAPVRSVPPVPSASPAPVVTTPALPPPLPPAAHWNALAEASAAAVTTAVPGTEVGLAVYDRVAGTVVVGVNADRPFYTASVVKLLIAIDVLHGAGWQVPTGPARDELVMLLSDSTDWVAASLWQARGGPEVDRRVSALVGLTDTAPPARAEQWEMSTMSPRDVLRVYQYVERMPAPARDLVLGALAGAPRLAADGFDQHFGIPAGLPGASWAIKQGWMQINHGQVLNTTGVVGPDRRYLVALLTRQPAGFGPAAGAAAVTAGIAALAPALAAGPAPVGAAAARKSATAPTSAPVALPTG